MLMLQKQSSSKCSDYIYLVELMEGLEADHNL